MHAPECGLRPNAPFSYLAAFLHPVYVNLIDISILSRVDLRSSLIGAGFYTLALCFFQKSKDVGIGCSYAVNQAPKAP